MNRLSRDLEKWREWKRRGQRSSAKWADANRSELERTGGLSRGKRINPRNPERLHRKRGGPPGSEERHTYGAFHFWIRQQPCEVTGERGEHIDGHHLQTVANLGRDYGNEVPLRHDLHMKLEQEGESWLRAAYPDLDLEAAAARWAERWDALSPEERAEIREAYRRWAES